MLRPAFHDLPDDVVHYAGVDVSLSDAIYRRTGEHAAHQPRVGDTIRAIHVCSSC